MEKFKCIIIDDEPLAVAHLKDNLDLLYKNIEVCFTCTAWSKALETIRANDVDIIFLDISMHDKNGMDLLKYVPNLKAEVIFITAYTEFALEAYKLSASGYVVKPIDQPELVHAVDKALERVRNKRLAKKALDVQPKIKIGIPDNDAIDYVGTADILYLKAVGTYTHVICSGHEFISSFNLQRFKNILPESIFFQVHRAYIVNLDHVRRYESGHTIIIDNNDQIPVARNFRDSFLKIFNRVSNQNIRE